MIEMLRIFIIRFDLENMEFVVEVRELKKDEENYNLQDFYEIIGCNLIAFEEYNDDICIIVDDEGALISGNPVLEVTKENGETLQLAGKLIFAKQDKYDKYSEGKPLVNMSSGEAFDLIMKLQRKISFIGVTA